MKHYNDFLMCHNADYTNVGSATAVTDTDYVAASEDTAAGTAVPYIIRKYTVHTEDREVTNTWTEIEQRPKYKIVTTVTKSKGNKYTGNGTDLDGVEVCIQVASSYLGDSLKLEEGYVNPAADKADGPTIKRVNDSQAAIYCFELAENNQYYLYTTDTDGNKRYLYCNNKGFGEWKGDWTTGLGFTENKNDAALFNVEKKGQYYNVYVSTTIKKEDKKQGITGNNHNPKYDEDCEGNFALNVIGGNDYGIALFSQSFNPINNISLYNVNTTTSEQQVLDGYEDVEVEKSETVFIKGGYPARCVTSTLGYYDINLTDSNYVLPDSFRGLGSVGYNDDKQFGDTGTFTNADNGYSERNSNRYCMKVDTFNGNNNAINVDVYLNKYVNDNYFNVLHKNSAATQELSQNTDSYGINTDKGMHGIGLFDSVVMRDSNSVFSDFTLSGSVNTGIFYNNYSTSGQEKTGRSQAQGTYGWLVSGGVVGHSLKGTQVNFTNIDLNKLIVRGSSCVGGLLGYSRNATKDSYIYIRECKATDISLDLSSIADNNSNEYRSAAGAFIGKIYEGGVKIYGTDQAENNTDTSKYSTVVISDYQSYIYKTVTLGGLVGYAGNGCEAYDMHVVSADNKTINIGDYGTSDVLSTGMSGGIVGLMQPISKSDGKSGDATCFATFKNCTIEKINIAGNYAGGLYGGTHQNTWSPVEINLINCEMVGDTSNNSTINARTYAGGFVAFGFVQAGPANGKTYNFLIQDSKVSDYTITGGSAGGFFGYANANGNNSVVCYIHDSSVENCTIGSGTQNAGGAIGYLPKNSSNRLYGYNLKLDSITTTSSNMGAWIGKVDSGDETTEIQFLGVAIYGNGFTKNVGVNNLKSGNASFVFAAYDESMLKAGDNNSEPKVSELNKSTTVEMPRYPYVNINPQMSVGGGKIISGDGAVLSGTASSASEYSGKTAEKTMALKIYEDTQLTDTSAENYSRRYTTFGTFNGTDAAKINGGNKIDHYMKRTVSDDGDRISNYYAEKGISTADYDNFACVVIANNTTNETTDLINRYAQLVTNTSTDYAGTDAANDYFDIKVASCKLKDGGFAVDTGKAGLKYENGKFSLDPSAADSLSATDTFTLVDIQFKDPFNKDKVAYHLYIPVYTIKEIEVTFYAAVMNGTNSVSYKADGTENENVYSTKLNKETSDTHVENLDTWYTTYIRYEYGEDDLNALLDSGDLNWNHNKYFYIDKTKHDTTYVLPESTYMILVDPNGNSDKQYQILLNNDDFTRQNVTSTTGRITFDLTKFKDSEGNNFSVSTFNEMIAKDIKAVEKPQHDGKYNLYSGSGTPSNTGKKYYVFTESENKTITYYEYVGSGGTHDLSLPKGYVLNESYYISMYVPTLSDSDPLYGYYIRTPEMFDAPVYESGTNNAITKSAKIKCHYISGNENNGNTQNRQVYIGTLFEQDTKLTVLTNDPEIDTGNRTLNIYVESTIRPKDNNVKTILEVVKTDIYHSFNVYLDRKGENGSITNTIYGLDGDEDGVPRIKAWYSIGEAMPKDIDADLTGFTAVDADSIDLQDNYINICTVNGGQEIMKDDGVTVYSRISMKFDNAYLKQQFPQKVMSDTGVSVRAASTLAYDAASLAFSSMSESAEEPSATKHIFYRQSMDSASLNYFAEPESDCFDLDGAPSENLSRLGISGKYSMNEYMPVNTTAQYNISNIESAAESAEKLSVTLSLQKKTDTPTEGTYTAVNYADVTSIDKYWGAVKRDAQTHEVEPDEAGKPVTDAGKTNLYIKCGNYENIVPVPSNAKTLSFEIPKDAVGTAGFIIDENGYININIGFSAKKGENFTEYANYRVNLSMRLLDGSNTDVGGSYADDYLIYTNAKVNHDFLTGN